MKKPTKIYPKVRSKKAVELTNRYLAIKEQMREFDAEAKQLLEAIVLEVGERNCEIEGHRLTRFKSACVSYKSIVEDYLEGVDLEPYRSSSHHWRIS